MYDKLRSEIQKRTDQHHTVLPKQTESSYSATVGNICQSKAEQDNSMQSEAAESEADDPDIIPLY